MTDSPPAKRRIFTRPVIVGLVSLALGVGVLIFMPKQWLAWSLLLLFAVKHLALLAAVGGPAYALFDRLHGTRRETPGGDNPS